MMGLGRLRRGGIFGTMMTVTLCTSAAAAEQCTFTKECFEGDACADTSFSMSIENGTLVTDAETIPVSSGGSDTVNAFVGFSASAMHLLTREKSGEARYTTHIFDGPLMVNYLGTCE